MCREDSISIALVLFAEWLVASVSSFDGSTFDEREIKLERTRTWRYG